MKLSISRENWNIHWLQEENIEKLTEEQDLKKSRKANERSENGNDE